MLKLSKCAAGITTTKETELLLLLLFFSSFLSSVRCHLSGVKCHVSPVTCHMSLKPTKIYTYPPPDPVNAPYISFSKYVLQDLFSEMVWTGDFCLMTVLHK